MNYPLISEYIEAIRSAEDNFDKLSNLRPVLDGVGNPVMSSGNFAVVFKMKDIQTNKFYAVKCFTREQEEREERYREIIKVLDEIKSPYFVSTKFYDKELFVDTSQSDDTEFPVLVMDWVEGLCLDKYMQVIRDNKARRELLAQKFQKFVCWLLPKHFAHGDLKPDNIIVKDDGNIVLVDYDGMFVPSLYGKPALELGTPMFRYKNRTLDDFNEYVDDYAAVFILLILKIGVIHPNVIENFEKEGNLFDITKSCTAFMNDEQIASIISAYIMVANYGYLDRPLIPSLLANRANFDLTKEMKLLYSARQGNTRDMIELAKLYEEGVNVAKNIDKSMKWYDFALKLGDANAACGFCICFRRDSDFSSTDYEMLFEKLHQFGCAFTYCRKGEVLLEDLNQKKDSLTIAANHGFIPALFRLAQLYEFTLKDNESAITFYTKAAEQGYTFAMHALWRIYKNNPKESIEWLIKAAKYGCKESQRELGNCFRKGDGVDKNLDRACFWYEKAAEQGDSYSQCSLGLLNEFGWTYKIDYAKAAYWYELAAKQGFVWAQYKLGHLYIMGKGVEGNHNEAICWLRKAAEQGFSDADRKLEQYCKIWNIIDDTNTNRLEINLNESFQEDTYSNDGKRFLCYGGWHGGEVVIKEGTEILCDDSLNDLYCEIEGYNLYTIVLPSTLKRIGNNVFCASVSEIISKSPNFTVENGFLLSSDKETLYRYFGKETIVEIPNGIKFIKGGAFSEKNVEKVIIPDTVMYIGDNPFAGCISIKEIISNSNRFKVRNNILYDVKEERLIGCWDYEASHMYIKSGTKSIGKNAFFGLGFQYIDIPDSIEDVDETSFYWCSNLCNNAIPSHQYKRIYNLMPSYIRKYILEDNGLPF